MVIPDNLGCGLQFKNVVDGFCGEWLVGQRLGWRLVDNDGVGILVLDHVHQWDAPQLVVLVPLSPWDGLFCHSDNGVVGVVDVDGVLVKHCDVVGIWVFSCA